MSEIALIAALTEDGVIGRDGGLPWRIPADLKRFKAITMGKPPQGAPEFPKWVIERAKELHHPQP